MNYKNSLKNPIFKIIAQASNELGIDSYVIGGFVRDYLLLRVFKTDIDVVAIGSGIDLALKVSELLPNKPKVQVFKSMERQCCDTKKLILNLLEHEKKVIRKIVEIL